MQKKTSASFLFLTFCIMVFSGCDKKDSQSANTTLITKDSWKFSTATVAGADVSNLVPDCYKDNIIDFFSDGTGSVGEGGNICNPSTAGIFSWSFEANETMLNMSTNLIPGGNGDFSIDALSETSLVISQETTLIPSPTPQRIVLTFIH